MTVQAKEISIAHSPDSDDAFMFYALAEKKLDTGGLSIRQVMKDIQTLNKEAIAGTYEVSAISFAAYPYIKDRYMLMPCGASMGDKYGPVVVARKEMTKQDLASAHIAIPGKLTSAYLVLNLYQPGLKVSEVPFEKIIESVVSGKYDAGLLIHEGQLTYKDQGLHKVVDLGQWWHEETGLPMPLGGNAIKKELGHQQIQRITRLMTDSIQYSLDHRKEALAYALTFARDMPEQLADKYVGMYVNELTVDCGENGRAAVNRMFAMACEKGLLDSPIVPEFVALD